MTKQEEVYRYWTENCDLNRGTAINNAMKKFKITWATARTYYPKWRKQFMKATTLVIDKPKPSINKDFDKLFDEKVKVTERSEKAENKEIIKRKILEDKEQKEISQKSIVENEPRDKDNVDLPLIVEEIAEARTKEKFNSFIEKRFAGEAVTTKEKKSRLVVKNTIEIEGNFVFFTSIEPGAFTIKDDVTGTRIDITELGDLIDELTELRNELRNTDI
ncbi:MAG: hypothetical protein Q8900_12085 [Bacillota bacterium]|nr:hypothetical protein [Bacillota bacterium]